MAKPYTDDEGTFIGDGVCDHDWEEFEDGTEGCTYCRETRKGEQRVELPDLRIYKCGDRSIPCEDCGRTKDVVGVNSLYLCTDCLSKLPKIIEDFLQKEVKK